MKIAPYLTALVAAVALFSCQKEDKINPEYVQKAEEFKSFIQSKQFQIKDYYSDKPIDYIEDDGVVRLETELWKYVSPWLKDDFNVFDNSTGKVTITQNALKIESNPAEVIVKDFKIGADNTSPYFDFLSHEYNFLKYRLVEFTDTHFVVYADWQGGGKVFTRFEVINP
jgi:hypothetical protein